MICSPSLGSSSSSQLSFSYSQVFSGCPDTHRWLWNTPWVHIKGNSPVELNQQPTCPYSPWTLALHATYTPGGSHNLRQDAAVCWLQLSFQLRQNMDTHLCNTRTPHCHPVRLGHSWRRHHHLHYTPRGVFSDHSSAYLSHLTALHSNSTLQFADDRTLVACTANNEQRADGDGGAQRSGGGGFW